MGRAAIHCFLIRLLWVGAALYPAISSAVGLSDLQLDSRLNQPLRAHVEVADITDEEWTHIRTRLNWRSDPDSISDVHPDVLDTISLRAVQDANHRHYIEIRSTEPIAEPLFDLPVEVAGSVGHIVRNYSVLLDPPSPTDDLPRHTEDTSSQVVASRQGSAATSRAESEAISSAASAATAASAPSAVRSRRSSHRQRAKAHSPASSSSVVSREGGNTSPNGLTGSPDVSASVRNTAAQERKELVTQLEMLQQTLAKMQETIAAQNAQISDLSAKVARAQPQPAHSAAAHSALPATAAPDAPTEAEADATDTESEAEEPTSHPRLYFWLIVALALTTLVIIISAITITLRSSRAAAQKDARSKPWSRSTDRQDDVATAGQDSLGTPAARQKQMEADGRVQITWERELWNQPEWVKLYGGQKPDSESNERGQDVSVSGTPDATANAAPGAEAPDTPLSDDEYLETVPDVYFSELPTTAKLKRLKSPPPPQESQTVQLSDTVINELNQAVGSELLGEETAKLANAYKAAIRERAVANELQRQAPTTQSDAPEQSDLSEHTELSAPEDLLEPESLESTDTVSRSPTSQESAITGSAQTELLNPVAAELAAMDAEMVRLLAQTANLTEIDPGELLGSDTTRLSESGAARLLSAEVTGLTEVDLTELTERDLTGMTDADAAEAAAAPGAAKPPEANSGDPSEDLTERLKGVNVRADSPKWKRRAGRRRHSS